MHIQKVFELIRKEDVVLWVGSGFSKYAGYPLSKELSATIYNSLTNEEKNEIQDALSLSDLTEEFVRIKGNSRNALNRILKDVFSKNPESLKWHELISKIPHIQTIITTNYDNCFELAFRNDCTKLVGEADIAYIDGKREVFKVHGDLAFLDSIIITKSDYANYFFNNEQSNVFWNTIIERIATKTVVFLGYGFEDDNIKNVFQKIFNALKKNRKEVFLIAPNVPKHKQMYLTELGIQYLDFKGEVFIEKLYKDVKENISDDFEKGLVRSETLRKFFLDNGLKVQLDATDTGYKVNSIKGINGDFNGLLSLHFKRNKNLPASFLDLVAGKKFEDVELDSKILSKFKFTASEINLLTHDIKDFKLTFVAQPKLEGFLDIEFVNGFEFNDINYQLFSSPELIQVQLKYKNLQLTFKADRKVINTKNIEFTYEITNDFRKTNDAMNIYSLLSYLSSGIAFKVYPKTTMDKTLDFSFQASSEFQKRIEAQLHYFTQLKKVEDIYNIKFREIRHGNDDYYELMNLAIDIFENKILDDANWNQKVILSVSESFNIEDFKSKIEASNTSISNGTAPLTIEEKINKEFEIHGQTVSIKGTHLLEFYGVSATDILDNTGGDKSLSEISFIAIRKRESFLSSASHDKNRN